MMRQLAEIEQEINRPWVMYEIVEIRSSFFFILLASFNYRYPIKNMVIEELVPIKLCLSSTPLLLL